MSSASPGISPRPEWPAAQTVWAVIIVAAAMANGLGRSHSLPLDPVLWTCGLLLGVYLCVWAGATLADRPLSSVADLRLRVLTYLILLTVAAWNGVGAARSSEWMSAVGGALIAAGAAGWLRVAWRKLREVQAGSGDSPER